MADLKDFAEKLVNLTVKEVNELADILKNEYGIEPAAAAAVAVAGPAGGAGGAAGAKTKREGECKNQSKKKQKKRNTTELSYQSSERRFSSP